MRTLSCLPCATTVAMTRGAGHQGSPIDEIGAVADGQHLVDRDLLADVRSNLFYLDLFAGSNPVLLATGFYDRVHVNSLKLLGDAAERPGRKPATIPRRRSARGADSRVPQAAEPLRDRRRRGRRGTRLSIIEAPPSPSVSAPTPPPAAASVGAVALMAADMREVDAVIRRRLASDVALIDQIAHYIISAGGKRIRPMLVLLFSNALGFAGPRALRAGGDGRVHPHRHAAARRRGRRVGAAARPARPPTRCSATRPACWSATSSTRAPSR